MKSFGILESYYGKVLVPFSQLNSEHFDAYRQYNCVGLYLNRVFNCEPGDVGCLKSIEGMKSLVITSRYCTSGLNDLDLSQLRDLKIPCSEEKLDFAKFPNLERLSTKCINKDVNWSTLKSLKSLWLSSAPSNIFSLLQNCESLEEIEIVNCKCESLNGIERLAKLKSVGIYYCPKLKDISALADCVELNQVMFSSSKAINDFSILGDIEQLNLIKLENVGELPTINWILRLPKIKNFVFAGDSTVQDLNIEPATNHPTIKWLFVRPRKAYGKDKCELIKGSPQLDSIQFSHVLSEPYLKFGMENQSRSIVSQLR